ncbi:MAG: AMP-binding protein [Proteobacteria bacterium]|nr:AMP-binding protein [Pseudomonadota bacterium]
MSHSPWISQYQKGVNPDISFGGLTSICDAVSSAFKKYAKQPAASCLGVTITYGEIQTSVNAFASFLQNTIKVEKGDRVALILPNSFQFIIAELAVLQIGAICVNTNPMYTPPEMLHQLADCGAKTVIVLDMIAAKLEEVIKETKIEHIILTSIADQLPKWKALPTKIFLRMKGEVPSHGLKGFSFSEGLKADPKLFKPVPTVLDDTAVLQYTGGTTGHAKGAMLTHRNILANMFQIREVTKPVLTPGNEVVLTALPLYHVFALSVNFLTFFAMGHHMILIPKPIPIGKVVEAFKKYPISVMTGVNTLFNSLNHSPEFKSLKPRTLKVAIAGGMALQDRVNTEFQAITGTKITEGFGLTEASPVTHVNPIKLDTPVGSIGIPLPSTLAKIVDDAGNQLNFGEQGELLISGPQVMKGYWNQPEQSALVLKDGWLWTGDIARMDERGYFFIVDRKKDMILVSGFNVYPNEIEEILAKHPKILEAAVVGGGEIGGNEFVRAFIVPKDPSLSIEEVKAHCKENMTGYKIPRKIEFLDSLPKSNVGKILRRELKNRKS